MKQTPRVSVVVTCYNDGEYIEEALCSVVEQSLPAMEIILVDDASEDLATVKYLEEKAEAKFKNLKVIRNQENLGVSISRNKGIQAAAGDFIVPLDGDDRLLKDFLAKTVPILEKDLKCGGVGTKARCVGAIEGVVPTPPYRYPDILFRPLLFSVGVFRKVDWKEVGGYKEVMREAWEDYEFWISILDLGKNLVQVPEVLFEYRQKTVEQSRNSWVSSIERRVMLHSRVFRMHPKLYEENAEQIFSRLILNEELQEAQRFLAPTFSLPEIWCGEFAVQAETIFPFGEMREICFKIPVGSLAELGEFRFDPTGCVGSLYIESIEFWNGEVCLARWIEEDLFSKLTLSGTLIPDEDYDGEAGRFFSVGSDPQLLIQLPGRSLDPDRLKIRMCFQCTILSAVDASQRNAAFMGKLCGFVATGGEVEVSGSRSSHKLIEDWVNYRRAVESDLATEKSRRRRLEYLKGSGLIRAFDSLLVAFWRLTFFIFAGRGGITMKSGKQGEIRLARRRSGIVEWGRGAQGFSIRFLTEPEEVWLESRSKRVFLSQNSRDGRLFMIGYLPSDSYLVRSVFSGKLKTLGYIKC